MAKLSIRIGHCKMFVEGMDMSCPLCGVLVQSGQTHECQTPEPKKKAVKKKK
jgi:hypothetical protein